VKKGSSRRVVLLNQNPLLLKNVIPLFAEALQTNNITTASQISSSIKDYQEKFAGYNLPPESKSKAESDDATDAEHLRLDQPLNDLLGKNGLFEQQLPFFHARASQLEMAAVTLDAFTESRTLLAEAPTGVGKSLAYLVPALHWVAQEPDAGRQVIVSSHTKVLQEQLLRLEC
jgi:hypothetical protein